MKSISDASLLEFSMKKFLFKTLLGFENQPSSSTFSKFHECVVNGTSIIMNNTSQCNFHYNKNLVKIHLLVHDMLKNIKCFLL